MSGKHYRKLCPTCKEIKLMRKNQTYCSYICGRAGYKVKMKARGYLHLVEAARKSVAVRHAKMLKKLEGLDKIQCFRLGYHKGYDAGWKCER